MAATFVVETGTGNAIANSYCSVANADQYHDDHSAPVSWTGATPTMKEKHLRLATAYLEHRFRARWYGQRTNETQGLSWPRAYVTDRDGFEVATNIVPQRVKDATAEMALRSLDGDVLVPDTAASANIKRERDVVGPIESEVEYFGQKTDRKSYPVVENLLAGLAYAAGEIRRA